MVFRTTSSEEPPGENPRSKDAPAGIGVWAESSSEERTTRKTIARKVMRFMKASLAGAYQATIEMKIQLLVDEELPRDHRDAEMTWRLDAITWRMWRTRSGSGVWRAAN
jgi:hypothetical protein